MARRRILNPKTGRMVLASGAVGRKILKKKSYKSSKYERCVLKVKKSLRKYGKCRGSPYAICRSSMKKRSRKRSGRGAIIQPEQINAFKKLNRRIAEIDGKVWRNQRFIPNTLYEA